MSVFLYIIFSYVNNFITFLIIPLIISLLIAFFFSFHLDKKKKRKLLIDTFFSFVSIKLAIFLAKYCNENNIFF
jgi:hypothetical protein